MSIGVAPQCMYTFMSNFFNNSNYYHDVTVFDNNNILSFLS